MLSAFLAGVAGGLLYCLPLSAVNVEIIRRGLTNGFVTALVVSVGAGTYPARAERFALYAGIIGGAVIYGFVASGLSAWGRRYVTPRTLRIVDRVAAVLFAGLAILLAIRTAVPVIPR